MVFVRLFLPDKSQCSKTEASEKSFYFHKKLIFIPKIISV